MSTEESETLAYNIILLTQGFINGVIDGSVKDPKGLFLEYISSYKDIDKNRLRKNLKAFLDDVIPTAEVAGVKLAIHPDDPPFPILGLPRIIGGLDDLLWLMEANPSPNNGFTFCAGSLSARADNDLVNIVETCGSRIHFTHLRNTQLLANGSFYESGHIQGTQDMPRIVAALLREQQRRKAQGRADFRIPVRPNHGIKILTDYDQSYNPGYPLVGRLRGLAEIEGLEAGILYQQQP